jgi:hypothetical protein
LNSPHPPIYSQCGLLIRSALPLELPTTSDERWDVDVRWGDDIVESGDAPPGRVIADFEDEETTWYTATQSESGYRLRFRDCGEFVISPDLSKVVVRGQLKGRSDLLPILLAGTVSAFLLSLRGSTVLHASAVAVDGAALAFVGRSGQGKTTVAALMCLAGAELVTDDVLVVDPGPPATCVGGASELRLRAAAAHLADAQPDRASRMTADERRAFAPRSAPAGPLPLAAIVIPYPSRTESQVRLHQLSPTDAMFTVMSFPRVFGWRRPDVLTRDFTVLGQLANQVPVYNATIPWGPPFDLDVAHALVAIASQTGQRLSGGGAP